MTKNLTEVKEKLLSTEYPRWRNLLSCAILVLLTTGMVLGWWYAYYTASDIECHKGILYFSAVWLTVQWVVIGYLYSYQNIPAFARGAIKLLILLGNVWFGLFIFFTPTMWIVDQAHNQWVKLTGTTLRSAPAAYPGR